MSSVESHHAQSAALHVRPVDGELQVDDATLVRAQPGRAHRTAARGQLLWWRTHHTDWQVTNEDAATERPADQRDVKHGASQTIRHHFRGESFWAMLVEITSHLSQNVSNE